MTAQAPESGVRYLFERASDDGGSARYAAQILLATTTYAYVARLTDDGSVELIAAGAAAPAALEDTLRMFARLTARGAPGRRSDGLVVWPPRVVRWRPVPSAIDKPKLGEP